MDVLSDLLNSVHISGSVLFHAEFGDPFAYASPNSEQYASMLVPQARRLMIFHLVLEGTCLARCAEGATVEVEAGNIIMLPRGDALVLADDQNTPTVPIFTCLPPFPWTSAPDLRLGGEGPRTRLICGFLYADEAILQTLTNDLPPLLVLDTHSALPRIQAMRDYVLDELRAGRPGGASMVNRLAEILFVEVLRHALTDGEHATLRAALRDPVVGLALTALHDDPARPWTIEEMARAAASSRSLLAERFHGLVGCPPIEYLTRWRMQLAARRLGERGAKVAAVAQEVGYDSEAAFSKAFKRAVGSAPGAYRRGLRSGGLEVVAA